jgi:hypothetical protein
VVYRIHTDLEFHGSDWVRKAEEGERKI